MYVVEIKESARESNSAVEGYVQHDGGRLEFDSRRAAENFASDISSKGGRVRIQAVAPQDPAPVDAYLIPFPARHIAAPKESPKSGLTFDVGANVYGELGNAVMFGTSGVSPALRYYCYSEIEGVGETSHYLRSIRQPYLPDDVPDDVSWSPDGLVQVRRSGELVDQYCCEVKTGNASFERGQVAGMRCVARYYPVLKIRVDIEYLPDECTVRITSVSPG